MRLGPHSLRRELPMPSVTRPALHGCAACALIFALFSLAPMDIPAARGADTDSKTVTLTIDFGDGFQKRYTELKLTPNMTVFDAMLAARKHSRPLKFQHRGKGETAFVSQIDGLKNDGAGRNWIFRVEGKLGKRSCGVTPIKAGDHVKWRFERYGKGR